MDGFEILSAVGGGTCKQNPSFFSIRNFGSTMKRALNPPPCSGRWSGAQSATHLRWFNLCNEKSQSGGPQRGRSGDMLPLQMTSHPTHMQRPYKYICLLSSRVDLFMCFVRSTL